MFVFLSGIPSLYFMTFRVGFLAFSGEFTLFGASGMRRASQKSARGPLLFSEEWCDCLNVAYGSVYACRSIDTRASV